MLTAARCYRSPSFTCLSRRSFSAFSAALPQSVSRLSMATVETSPAMVILDRIIDHVSKLNVSSTSSSSSHPTTPSTSSSSTPSSVPSFFSPAPTSSYLPAHTVDVAWRPIVPVGHTVYTWVGDDDAPPTPAAVSASSPAAVATPTPDLSPSPADPAVPAPASDARAKAPPKEKKAGAPKAAKAEEVKNEQPDISRLDIRVGQVLKAWKHPEAEKLYVEEIDVGEEKPRQVVSGLVEFVPLEQFQGSRLCVICNLKPSALRGVTSYGMVLAASNADRSVVELIAPPASAPVGTRLTLSTVDVLAHTPDAVIDPKKKGNVWERIKGGLRTDDEGRATFDGAVWKTPQGDCTANLKNAVIS